jgi:hypothetical protein
VGPVNTSGPATSVPSLSPFDVSEPTAITKIEKAGDEAVARVSGPSKIPVEPAETRSLISEPLVALPPADPVPHTAVIQFEPDTSRAQRQDYLTSIGATVQNDLMVLDTVTLPSESSFNAQSASKIVVSVEPDYYVSALREWPTRDPCLSEQWAMPAIHAQTAWAKLPLAAETVLVAVIDSGICAAHPDLMGRSTGSAPTC